MLALRFLLACVAASGLAACTSKGDRPRLVLLYATCSLNKNFLQPYDSAVQYTPSFAAFAKDALVFERHQTEAGQSGISFASIFSGMQAPGHGVFMHPSRIADDRMLIGEAFAAAGYDTYAFLGHQMASPRLNYAQGVSDEHAESGKLVADSQTFRTILDRLVADPSYEAFIVTNFTVTHGPYRGRLLEPFCRKYPEQCGALADRAAFERYRALYRSNHLALSWDFDATVERLGLSDAEVHELAGVLSLLYRADVYLLDGLFGEVIAEIGERGLLDESLVAFTSDHGEIHYRDNAHFKWTHGRQLAPEVLNVAFMLRGGGVRPGRYEGVSRSIDVFPTLAGLASVPLPLDERRGVDLSPAVRGEAAPPHLVAFSHTDLMDAPHWQRYRKYSALRALFPEQIPELMWTAARDGDLFFKLRREDGHGWKTSLYDLGTDPGETHDLYDADDASHVRMTDELERYKRELVEAAYSARGSVPRKRAIELLRALGYID